MSAAADALVRRLPRITLVVGKGGVGKSTTAAAVALHTSRRVGPTQLVSTDPARALAAVLGVPVGSEPTAVGYAKGLTARHLDAAPLRAGFMARWSGVIRLIVDRGTYLDDADIGPLVDTALPGGDEVFSALALAELIAGSSGDAMAERLVVDTAPTGHTLRLLNLPRTFRALLRLLESMQSKHRFMVRALTRAYRADDADDFLREVNALVAALEDALRDPEQCTAIIVTQPPELVREETRRYLDALRELQVDVAAVLWNAVDGDIEPLGNAAQFRIPRLAQWPTGERGLSAWIDALVPVKGELAAGGNRRPASGKRQAAIGRQASPAAADPARLLRPLTIVAGKGGVGKTTVAAALALHAAQTLRVLVVSTDPAPSLADALRQPVPDADTPVSGAPLLRARQMDASAAFARLRDEYQSRVDALFDGLLVGGMDLSHDRAVARDLLSLAPPGVDEVYALSLLSDALFGGDYARVVVDPAPTGHLLRLLEMPQLALAWCHQILRLMLRYKEVAGLGDSAADVLAFSRNLRGLDSLLRDADRCAVVVVTLDEPVVLAETDRLASEVDRLGVSISGVVRNRAFGKAALPVRSAPVHFEAPVAQPAPVGVDALRAWTRTWVT